MVHDIRGKKQTTNLHTLLTLIAPSNFIYKSNVSIKEAWSNNNKFLIVTLQ